MKILADLMKVVIVVSNSQNVANPYKVPRIKHFHLPCTDLVIPQITQSVRHPSLFFFFFSVCIAFQRDRVLSTVTMKRHWGVL